ncbi:MAG: glycoside hydrolase family 15 protein [Geminicoccaceae bacterium]|nr:glycoside hydrolase family 15 protein [Geminicoccaceae bacterium]
MHMMDYGLIGNCAINALIDASARIVWSCFPRFDSEPIFCRLLDGDRDRGYFGVELEDCVSIEQAYVENTAVLRTEMRDARGAGIRILDFAPRFEQFGRMFHPTTLVRIVEPLGEGPRIKIACRPLYNYGAQLPVITRGSNHIRYVDDIMALRLTTNAPLTYVLDEITFHLDGTVALLLGADESLRSGLVETARDFLEKTTRYWLQVSGRLNIPFEWQEAVIRSAITLKLCSFEETGAIIASPTTSLPETDGEGRNWDYRFCWLRDAFFVVRALNRLGYVETMESHLRYLSDLVARSEDGYLQPVYGIGLEKRLTERVIDSLEGFLGNQPVRVGNQAYEHDQHDGYGSVILAATQAFFDRRLRRPAGRATFERLELLGDKAWALHDVPDAGLWEFRTKARVHTHSSVMCWAACDRLARIAARLELVEREIHWRGRADHIRAVIEERAWNPGLGSYTASFDDDDIDASLLLIHEVGFLQGDDPRFAGTVKAVEERLKVGPYVYRYRSQDDFGEPENAFLICSFWYVDALIALGRRDEARALFERLVACRNRLGLLSEHINRTTGELWGNFPQTYSHVGLINCAMRLSRPWEDVV